MSMWCNPGVNNLVDWLELSPRWTGLVVDVNHFVRRCYFLEQWPNGLDDMALTHVVWVGVVVEVEHGGEAFADVDCDWAFVHFEMRKYDVFILELELGCFVIGVSFVVEMN